MLSLVEAIIWWKQNNKACQVQSARCSKTSPLQGFAKNDQLLQPKMQLLTELMAKALLR
jgi:hypothetical protein